MNPLTLASGSAPWDAYFLPFLFAFISLTVLCLCIRDFFNGEGEPMAWIFVIVVFLFVGAGVLKIREPHVATTGANRSAVEQHYHSTITGGDFPNNFQLRSKTGRESAGCSVEVDEEASAKELKTHVLCSGMEPESN